MILYKKNVHVLLWWLGHPGKFPTSPFLLKTSCIGLPRQTPRSRFTSALRPPSFLRCQLWSLWSWHNSGDIWPCWGIQPSSIFQERSLFGCYERLRGDKWGEKLRFFWRFWELAMFMRWCQKNAAVEQWNIVSGMLCSHDYDLKKISLEDKDCCSKEKFAWFGRRTDVLVRCFSTQEKRRKGSEDWYMDDLRLLDMKIVEKLCFLNWVVLFPYKTALLTIRGDHFKVGNFPVVLLQKQPFDDASNFPKTQWFIVRSDLDGAIGRRISRKIRAMPSRKRKSLLPKIIFTWKQIWNMFRLFFRGLTYLVNTETFPKKHREILGTVRLLVETERKLQDFTLEQLVLVSWLSGSLLRIHASWGMDWTSEFFPIKNVLRENPKITMAGRVQQKSKVDQLPLQKTIGKDGNQKNCWSK